MGLSDAPPANFPDQTVCKRCHGPKWRHEPREVCDLCVGTGRITPWVSKACPQCLGTGRKAAGLKACSEFK